MFLLNWKELLDLDGLDLVLPRHSFSFCFRLGEFVHGMGEFVLRVGKFVLRVGKFTFSPIFGRTRVRARVVSGGKRMFFSFSFSLNLFWTSFLSFSFLLLFSISFLGFVSSFYL